MGLTLYLHHRNSKTIMNQVIMLQDGRTEWSNQYIDLVERGYKPILGILWSPIDRITIGLTVAKTFLYSGSKTSQLLFKDADDSEPIPTFDTFEKRKYPSEVRVGVAYFASSSLLFTADGSYYSKVDDPAGDRVSVFNAAVGTEYYLGKSLAVRGGLFTNMANTPELQAGRSNQDEKIDYYGLSASISSFTRNTSLTFGGNISTGSGEAQIIGNSTNIQNVDSTGWTIFVSSSYSY
jgi:long-chain fatty acid transport protein